MSAASGRAGGGGDRRSAERPGARAAPERAPGGTPRDATDLPWTLSYQTVLPDDYRRNDAVAARFSAFARAGLWGLELNVSDPASFSYDEVVEFLAGFGLKLSMFATGLSAKSGGFSLSAADEDARRRAVEECAKYLRWVGDDDVGAIIGFMKGMDRSHPESAREAMRRSVLELAPVAEQERTPLIIEATNRYETPIANSLADALELVEGTPAEWVKVLPDTFHMNIEEADQREALTSALPRIMHVHLSENNRTLPGCGAFDFAGFLNLLDEIGFRGRLAMEGNIVGDEGDDVARAAEAVRAAWRRTAAGRQ